jgi:hypothetical protein
MTGDFSSDALDTSCASVASFSVMNTFEQLKS